MASVRLSCDVCGEVLRIGTPGMGIIVVRECSCQVKETYHGQEENNEAHIQKARIHQAGKAEYREEAARVAAG